MVLIKQANLEIQLHDYQVAHLKEDEKINEIMDNDFNTSNLITYLLDLVKELNSQLRAKENFISSYDKILLITYILGLVYNFKELNEDDKQLYTKWIASRDKKDFATADCLRKELIERNII